MVKLAVCSSGFCMVLAGLALLLQVALNIILSHIEAWPLILGLGLGGMFLVVGFLLLDAGQ